MYHLDDENSQLNSYVNGKFDFILTDEDLSKNLSVNYACGVTPMEGMMI